MDALSSPGVAVIVTGMGMLNERLHGQMPTVVAIILLALCGLLFFAATLVVWGKRS